MNNQDIYGREHLILVVDREIFNGYQVKEVKRVFWKGYISGLFAAGCNPTDDIPSIYVEEEVYKNKDVLDVLLMHEYAHLHLMTIDEEEADEYAISHIEDGVSKMRNMLKFLHTMGGEDYSIPCTANGWVLGDELHPDPYVRDIRYVHREKYFR